MSTITIEVSTNDIAGGARGDAMYCPIATAIRRELPAIKPRVYGKYLLLIESRPNALFTHDINCPEAVARFVQRFDDHRRVEPFRFDLELPDYLLAKARGEATS